jgi:ATP-dependent helicase HrpB
MPFDPPLPIDDALPQLTDALRAPNAAVLVAPPGAGKTTRVPLVLLGEPWAKGKILLLEPRRLAARAAAARMASRSGGRNGGPARAFRFQGLAPDTH